METDDSEIRHLVDVDVEVLKYQIKELTDKYDALRREYVAVKTWLIRLVIAVVGTLAARQIGDVLGGLDVSVLLQ